MVERVLLIRQRLDKTWDVKHRDVAQELGTVRVVVTHEAVQEGEELERRAGDVREQWVRERLFERRVQGRHTRYRLGILDEGVLDEFDLVEDVGDLDCIVNVGDNAVKP